MALVAFVAAATSAVITALWLAGEHSPRMRATLVRVAAPHGSDLHFIVANEDGRLAAVSGGTAEISWLVRGVGWKSLIVALDPVAGEPSYIAARTAQAVTLRGAERIHVQDGTTTHDLDDLLRNWTSRLVFNDDNCRIELFVTSASGRRNSLPVPNVRCDDFRGILAHQHQGLTVLD